MIKVNEVLLAQALADCANEILSRDRLSLFWLGKHAQIVAGNSIRYLNLYDDTTHLLLLVFVLMSDITSHAFQKVVINNIFTPQQLAEGMIDSKAVRLFFKKALNERVRCDDRVEKAANSLRLKLASPMLRLSREMNPVQYMQKVR